MVSAGTEDDLGQARAEARHLREMIDALRERLEAAVVERNVAVQQAVAQSVDEVAQLKASVEALRSALTAAHDDAATEREALERAFRSEREGLHEMIVTLRASLETEDGG